MSNSLSNYIVIELFNFLIHLFSETKLIMTLNLNNLNIAININATINKLILIN